MSSPLFSPETLFLVLGSFLLGGFAKGVVGLGMPVVVLAVIATPLGVPQSLAVLVLPAMLTNVWQALDGGALRQILSRLWPFYLAASIGVLTGGALQAGSSPELLLALLGAVLSAYALLALLALRPPQPAPRRESWMAPAAALSGGVMFGLVGNFIVPGILYLEALRLPRDMFVQALGVTFMVISTTLALSLTRTSVMSWDLAALSALAMPMAFLGMALGRRCRRLVSEQAFRRLFFLALLAAGVNALAHALV